MQDEALDLREILAGFRRWWWVFLAAPLLIGAGTAGAAIASPVPDPRYESSATLLVEGATATGSYPSLIVSRPFLKAVLDQSALDLSLDEIVAKVSARRVPETEFLEIVATTADPATGRQVADAVAAAFIGHVESIREEQLAVQHTEVEQGVAALGLFPPPRRSWRQ